MPPATTLKRAGALTAVVAGALLFISCSSTPPPQVTTPPAPPPETSVQPPLRGVWLTTVNHLDWPPADSASISDTALRIRVQQQSLIARLEQLKSLGINTVFFQVKPDGSALWASKILPWSELMTGHLGRDPGFDPLRFILDEAHKRGIKVHAWFNPYRVTVNTLPATIAAMSATRGQSPSSVYLQHPEWIRTAAGRFVLDPGIPAVRDWITSIVTEVTDNYPVDGVQFDDYFYTESSGAVLDDNQTFWQYGQAFDSKPAWRRHNTQLLIEQVSRAIRQHKPEIVFGISPAGIWRNRSQDPAGSDTRGAATYDESYADTRLWVQQGLLDYIAPQLYWPFGREVARYDVLARWWADVVKPTRTRLYIGVALYKVGNPSASEPDWGTEGGVAELKKQLDLNEQLPQVSGTILFRAANLDQPQTREAVSYLRSRWGQ
ncbi:glycoside hydrolase family 10 protein [Shimwellia blattae]|uniref:Putative lipoprotein YddW n=1 Tax=Shimwellia blattae (strain ATCC 29907 / DSM 4481 / JCM 1650 / NBRC 105725 / CDC 9005-74) TaxID=630626 RepID=I2B932_SHIBC|nr:glycoside hydrolase family 10 protein [Shimwellia blattae]AFJ47036.1 putative lipoprotein YddW [Shimwellia blattae DSM 4481 = NBRC 105725]GAB80841.1 hypothetical protein YddW [Shimwellia blattae DSM 4481 = NBRC 105725]VDY64530.1 Uncharacterized protein conserved in bacteria [Shimwellia blattae]VEC22638.1 Uncharacterized protein conserved in bacteria [Shimwellia blattae]